MLISKTDYRGEGKGEFYETHLEKRGTVYYLFQSTNGAGPVSTDEETVLMNRQQAIDIAKTILRNEGITSA
ncbi:hypothetical protein [Pectobacterium phage PPWS2]|uniref:Uncharacterized protein n=1 Tax=Pectobacterium phage PPWS2 TaxID=2153295 RepID=A0A3G9E5G1_9CAUD|nr:hypothetical protein HOU58_gp32 [Pectobacterium phage PPWS2]BBD74664.1 hypothetical protein [Pectobacterium phage PPWS2]